MSPLNKFQPNTSISSFTDILLTQFAHFDFPQWRKSRTPKATKIEIFVSRTNDSQTLTVIIRNVFLDVTGVLEPSDRL